MSEAELIWVIKYQLKRLSRTLRKNLASDNTAARDVAIQLIAQHIVKEALGRFEVLSSAPESKIDLFSHAAYGTGAGSAPMHDDPD